MRWQRPTHGLEAAATAAEGIRPKGPHGCEFTLGQRRADARGCNACVYAPPVGGGGHRVGSPLALPSRRPHAFVPLPSACTHTPRTRTRAHIPGAICCTVFSVFAIVLLVSHAGVGLTHATLNRPSNTPLTPSSHRSATRVNCADCLQTMLGLYLKSESPYIRIGVDKQEAASNVFWTAGLYGVTLLLSLYYWRKGVLRLRGQ